MSGRGIALLAGAIGWAAAPSAAQSSWTVCGADAALRVVGPESVRLDGPRTHAELPAGRYEVHFADGPGRFSFIDERDRIVDVCFVAADRYGDRWCTNRQVGRGEPDYPFDCFTYGWVAGQQVSCLNPDTQVAHHLGYEVEPVDRWDVELLRTRFDLPVPEGLRPTV